MTRILAVALACVGLAACRTLPPASAPGGLLEGEAERAAAKNQALRVSALGLAGVPCDIPAWAMSGRVALSNGRDGGSGRIEWVQGSGQTRVTLSAPVTRQSWTLTAGTGGVMLEGLPGGTRQGADAAPLLREATGWEIPVAALGCWLRGAPAPEAAMGPARAAYGADGRLARLEQGGWTIDFQDWKDDPPIGPALPGRINAEQAANRVRLVVDRWGRE